MAQFMSDQPTRILVTGAAGFIGSALIRTLVRDGVKVLAFDALTYAGSRTTLADVEGSPDLRFVHAETCDADAVARTLADFRPDIVTHLAAESHADRSIDSAGAFVRTNLVGTCTMLAEAYRYWREVDNRARGLVDLCRTAAARTYGATVFAYRVHDPERYA